MTKPIHICRASLNGSAVCGRSPAQISTSGVNVTCPDCLGQGQPRFNDAQHQEMAAFAEQHGLDEAAAATLPAVFTEGARQCGVHPSVLITASLRNPDAAGHIADVARTAARCVDHDHLTRYLAS